MIGQPVSSAKIKLFARYTKFLLKKRLNKFVNQQVAYLMTKWIFHIYRISCEIFIENAVYLFVLPNTIKNEKEQKYLEYGQGRTWSSLLLFYRFNKRFLASPSQGSSLCWINSINYVLYFHQTNDCYTTCRFQLKLKIYWWFHSYSSTTWTGYAKHSIQKFCFFVGCN